MHKTFCFEPEIKTQLTHELLLKPMNTIGSAIAGAALRSFILIAANSREIFPGLQWGRVHLPVPLMISHNNMHKGEIGKPVPAQIIEMPNTADGVKNRCWIIIYTDRSALIARQEDDCGDDLTHPLMRVLPVVLKLTSKARPRHRSEDYTLSVASQGASAQLMAKTKRGAAPFPMLIGPYPDMHTMNDIGVIQSQLHREVRAWADEIERAPLVSVPNAEASHGVFGVDQEPPIDTLEGLPWAWPAVMEYTGFTDESFQEAKRFYHLAFTYLWEQNKDRLGELAVLVNSGQSRQDGRTPKVALRVSAWERGVERAETEARIRSEFRALLRHEKAPSFLLDFAGQAVVDDGKGVLLSAVRPWTIYLGTHDSTISQHDKLAAYALFTA